MMTDRTQLQITAIATEHWHELRDERGKLCARLDERRLLLELHRNREWVTFDLRDYLDVLRGLDIGSDIE
jgi:hypothetical protein